MKNLTFFTLLVLFLAGCQKDIPSSRPGGKPQRVVDISVPVDFDWQSVSSIVCDFSADGVVQVGVASSEDGEPFATFLVGEGLEPAILSVPRAQRTLWICYMDKEGEFVRTALPVSERLVYYVPAIEYEYLTLSRVGNPTVGTIFYPNNHEWGTLMFEDLWPGYGDYDFNDFVVNYQIREDMHNKNKIDRIAFLLIVRSVGGSLPYDFYIGMPELYLDDLAEVNILSCENAASEVIAARFGGDKKKDGSAVIELKGLRNNANRPIGSTYFNTEKGYEVADDDLIHITLEVVFKHPVAIADLTLDKFDFFLGRTDDFGRRIEVHMGGYAPSVQAWDDYYAIKESSTTIDAAQKPYFSNTHLVWALNLPYEVKQVYESTDFMEAYPAFGQWVQSGGLLAQDWYLHSVESLVIKPKR